MHAAGIPCTCARSGRARRGAYAHMTAEVASSITDDRGFMPSKSQHRPVMTQLTPLVEPLKPLARCSQSH